MKIYNIEKSQNLPTFIQIYYVLDPVLEDRGLAVNVLAYCSTGALLALTSQQRPAQNLKYM